MQLSPNQKIFCEFFFFFFIFFAFSESTWNMEYFEKKKMSLGAYLFLKLKTTKREVT